MKGHLSKRTQFVREIVKEVSGYVFLECRRGSFAAMMVSRVGTAADNSGI